MTGNETKRDVLEKLAECYAEVSDAYTSETGSPYYCGDEPNYLEDYDAALPDDLPVIPKAVGKYIKTNRGHMSLTSGIENAGCISEWLWGKGFDYGNDSVFARAWLLGVWRV
ncbi:hypothetical protein [Lacticaseibacillus paracasei]|uniref:hypothetical protein n=1 Tax=Lacticaseibacillus paracasei TaxID=1597 RepID=UPI001CC0DEBC|nr:hypothetical protein [Lacticaseibacillus paracasei]MBZ3797372.1 hypothetical protein [Lacticaseibacillus paracasei]